MVKTSKKNNSSSNSNSNNNNTQTLTSAEQVFKSLSKNEQTLVKNWVLNIRREIAKSDTSLENIRNMLENYKSKDPKRTEIIRQSLFSIEDLASSIPSLMHCVIAKLMLYDPAIPLEKVLYDKYKALLKMFMDYGAKPSICYEIASPFELYSEFENKFTKGKSNAYRHKDLIEILSADLEIHNLVNDKKNNLVICAASNGDYETIEFILGIRPDLLDKADLTGRHIVLELIVHKHEDIAIKFIEKYQPKLNRSYPPGLTLIQCALQVNQPKAIQALLDYNCPISTANQGHMSNDKNVIRILEKSGYFLCENNVRSAKQNRCYFTIESENEYEFIYDVEMLKASKIIPNQKEIRRLHASFKEVIENSNNLVLKELYHVFCEKFPTELNGQLSVGLSLKPDFEYHLDESMFSVYIDGYYGELKTIQDDQNKIQSLVKTLSDFFEPTLLATFKSETNLKAMIDMNNNIKDGFKNNEKISVMTALHYIGSNIVYKILPIYLVGVNKESFLTLVGNIGYLLMSAEGFVLHKYKPIDDLLFVLNLLLKTADDLDVVSTDIYYIKLLRTSLFVSNYTGYRFYKELQCILSDEKVLLYIKKSFDNPFFITSFYFSLNAVLERVYAETFDIDCQIFLIESVLRLCSEPDLLSRTEVNENIDKIKKKAEFLLKCTRKRYIVSCHEITKDNDFLKYTYDQCSAGITVNFSLKYDKTKVSELLKSYPMIRVLKQGLYVTLWTYEYAMVIDALNAINKIRPEDIKLNEADTHIDNSNDDSSASSSGTTQYYLPPLAQPVSRPVSYFKNNNLCKSEPETIPAVITQYQPDLVLIEAIKGEITQKLGIAQGIMIYNIYNKPEIADNRRHFFWALWFAQIIKEDCDFIPDADLEQFKLLIENGGKFARKAIGENGLRPAMVLDAADSKVKPSYKLKLASKGPRIYAAPLQVTLSDSSVINLYCFGFPVKHKTQERGNNVVTVDLRKCTNFESQNNFSM